MLTQTCEYLCGNVYTCVRETSVRVPDVLRSSSVLKRGQTAGLIWTHTVDISTSCLSFSHLILTLCLDFSQFLCILRASAFMFSSTKAVHLQSGPGICLTWFGAFECVSVCVCQTGNMNHVNSMLNIPVLLSPLTCHQDCD